MAQSGYYKCSVEGDYFAKEAGGKTVKRYALDFNVPNLGEDKSDTHYLSVIKKELLNKQLKAKYPTAITYRTHEMVDRVYVGANNKPQTQTPQPNRPKTVSNMNKQELTDYIAVNSLNIDLEIYPTVDKMRQAIVNITADEAKFLTEQADARADLDMKNTLNDLNPTPPVDTDAAAAAAALAAANPNLIPEGDE